MKIHWFDDEQKQDIKKVYKFYHGNDVLPCILCNAEPCPFRDDLHGFCKFNLSKAEREVKKRYERIDSGIFDSIQCDTLLHKQLYSNVQQVRYSNFRASYVLLDIRHNLLGRFDWHSYVSDQQERRLKVL